MYRLTLGTNTSRRQVEVEPTMIVRELLEMNNVNYTNTTLHLDGIPLTTVELNRSLADLGVSNGSFIIAVVKCDNANA